MIARPTIAFAVIVLASAIAPAPAAAQRAPMTVPGAPKPPERPVRRDIPMTDMIRRAFAAGTRDSTGRPGRNYWQLWTDYRINARLDSATSVVSAREVVTDRKSVV